MIFEHSDITRAWINRVQEFMDAHVYPAMATFEAQEAAGERWKVVPVI